LTPKKILFLSHDAELQGAERCLLDLVTRLDRERFEPLVLLPWKGPLVEILERAHIPYVVRHISRWIPSRRNAPPRYFRSYFKELRARLWSLLSLIERENVQLVYTNTSTLLEGALAARRAGIPHLWHIHEHLRGNPDLKLPLPATWIDRITLALSNRILTPSKVLAKSRFPNSAKVRIVPNGIDLNAFNQGDGASIRREFAIPDQAPLITFIGAVSRTKDPLTFARAASLIQQEVPEARFFLAGAHADPDLAAEVERFASESDIRHWHMPGFRKDAADILAAATVHVSTSIRECLPLNLIEAMAAGKPVVATRCGGPEEVVADGETGFVVPPKDPEATAAAVLKLLNDPALAARMGAAGRRRVERHFTADAYARRIEAVIGEALAGR